MENRLRWFRVSPMTRRRIANFKANKRGYWSFWIFTVLFAASVCSELIANDKPLLVRYGGEWYLPVAVVYPETAFGGDFETEADYRDPFTADLIRESGGWMLWPPVPYRYNTADNDLPGSAPTPPDRRHWLGTDDHGRDVVAWIFYGFRTAIFFGLTLMLVSSFVGIVAGATQGYFGGWVDLAGQRFMEIWEALPSFYILIILSSIVEPSFWWLLGILLLFSWPQLVGVVRAEFLRGRKADYVEAARALGMGNVAIMFKHIFPNAMVATITYAPFILAGAITVLASLDFLGFGLPVGSPSLGELLAQGKTNVYAAWLGISGFTVMVVTLTLLNFIGEAMRDAFDPRNVGG